MIYHITKGIHITDNNIVKNLASGKLSGITQKEEKKERID